MAVRARSAKESVLEQKIVKHAIDCGMIVIKMNITGNRGWPDRLFLPPQGRAFFIEFKREGEKPRPLQEYRHEQLRKQGYQCFVVDNEADGFARLASTSVSAPRC